MSFLNDEYVLAENQRLEFKDALGGLPDDIWETYSAFANTEGGEIVLGVHEDSSTHEFSLVGVHGAHELVDAFWLTLRNPTKVERDVMLRDGVKVVTRNGMDFVVIKVPHAERGDKPVCVYDRRQKRMVAYVRRGTSDVQAGDSDLSLMMYDKTSSADRRVLNDFGLDCLCAETLGRYRSLFTALKPGSPWVDDSDDDFLYHVGAATRDSGGTLKLTRAGLLAFGYEYAITDYLPHYLLDYREEISGNDRWDDRIVSQDGDWSGNLVDFYLNVSQRLKRHFKSPFGADEYGMAHASRNPVTESANEAVVNALVHAFYGDSCTVKIILTSNALMVTNPGGFLIDSTAAIAGGISEPRNPTLMRMFGLIGASDRAGSGLQKIWKTWQDAYGVAPTLEEMHGPAGVRLTLPLFEHDSATPVHALETAPSAREIREVLSGVPEGLTSGEIAARAQVSQRTAQKWLKRLVDAGAVSRVREGGAVRYRV